MLGSITMRAHPPRLHCLGLGSRPTVSADGFRWPHGVDWDAADPRRPLWLWEGVAHGHAAARLTPAEALAPAWRAHLALCDASWLVPLLERMAAGEHVAWDDIVRAHVAARGAQPVPLDTDQGTPR